MIAFLIIIHVICCLGLILIVLLQAGRGAGLASTFGASAVESALGAGASDFLKKATTVMAVIFMLTSLSLAFVGARKSASVMKNTPAQTQAPAGVPESSTTRQVKVTPEGKEIVEEKKTPGFEKKSQKDLQQVLKEVAEKIPLGQKSQKDGEKVEKVSQDSPQSSQNLTPETSSPKPEAVQETLPSSSAVSETAVQGQKEESKTPLQEGTAESKAATAQETPVQ